MPGSKTGKRIRVPRLRNILDVKGPTRPGTLIHFSDEQWERAIDGIPRGKAVPKFGVGLECYPIPGGVVAQPICIQNPCEICRVLQRFGPGGEITYQCFCKPDPRCEIVPPPPPPSPLCVLRIERRRGIIRLRCASNGCRARCQLQIIRQQGRFVITCRCV